MESVTGMMNPDRTETEADRLVRARGSDGPPRLQRLGAGLHRIPVPAWRAERHRPAPALPLRDGARRTQRARGRRGAAGIGSRAARLRGPCPAHDRQRRLEWKTRQALASQEPSYLVGNFLVTRACNIPRNEALAAVDPANVESMSPLMRVLVCLLAAGFVPASARAAATETPEQMIA